MCLTDWGSAPLSDAFQEILDQLLDAREEKPALYEYERVLARIQKELERQGLKAPEVSYTGLPQRDDYLKPKQFIDEAGQLARARASLIQERLASLTSRIQAVLDASDLAGGNLIEELEALGSSGSGKLIVPVVLSEPSDPDKTQGEPLQSFGTGGGLLLPFTFTSRWTDGFTISLDAGLLLGDVRRASGYDEGAVFAGVRDPRTDLSSLFDGRFDTGCVFERFEVPREIQEKPYCFRYAEGVSMLLDGSAPSVSITIEPDSPRTTNLLFIAGSDATLTGRLDAVEIEERYGKKIRLSPAHFLERPYLLIQEPVEVRRVKLVLSQPRPEYVPLALWAYTTPTGTLIPGPAPSLAPLGYKYDPYTRKVQGPKVRVGEEHDPSAVFLPPDPAAIQRVVRARRYALSLREIVLGEASFAAQGEWVSRPMTIPSWTRKLTFQGTGVVPLVFGEGDWLATEISFDDGNRWEKIQVAGVTTSGYREIRIDPAESSLPEDILAVSSDASSFRIRVRMKRHPSYPVLSPSVSAISAVFDQEVSL